jgi:hypothetical protein
MEKIAVHRVIIVGPPMCEYTNKLGGIWRMGCHTYFYYIGEIKRPVGCHFRCQN